MTNFFIDQHGCAKNQVDGELIVSNLLEMGLTQTFEPEKADLIIVNSCGFINSAKKESLDAVVQAKEAYPHAKILLTGCLAERYAETLNKSLPEADGIFGNGNISKIKEFVQKLQNGERPVEVYEQKGVCAGERKILLGFRGSAFVKITEGCSNHCTFCAIPLIRGELRSRPADEIISEIKSLLSKGIVEFNLIGQDLAAYGTGLEDNVFGDGRHPLPELDSEGHNLGTKSLSALARLLMMISEIQGSFIVRILYIHPDHFNRDILSVIKKDKRLLPYFDIPFQSGDTETIRRMNRKGSYEEYLKLVRDIKAELPEAVLRTTFLTGFPGEKDKAFKNTFSFLQELKSDWSGCFPYSLEEDTPASKFKHRVSSKKAQKRADLLVQEQAEITRENLKKYIGKEFDVLVEEVLEGEDGLAIGRAWFQAPEVDGSVVVRYEKDVEAENKAVQCGKMIKVKIVASSDVDLDAVYVGKSEFESNNVQSSLLYATDLAE